MNNPSVDLCVVEETKQGVEMRQIEGTGEREMEEGWIHGEGRI